MEIAILNTHTSNFSDVDLKQYEKIEATLQIFWETHTNLHRVFAFTCPINDELMTD